MTHKTKQQKQDKRPIRYIEKMIASFSDSLFPKSRKQGINVGKNNPPKPESDILEIPYVGTIIAKVTSIFNHISGSLEDKIQENRTKFEQAYNQLKNNNIIASLSSKIKGLESIKNSDLKDVDKNIEQELAENLAEQGKLEKQIRQSAIAIAEHPYKNVFWPLLFAVLFSGVSTFDVTIF
jgi:hypothetical protein